MTLKEWLLFLFGMIIWLLHAQLRRVSLRLKGVRTHMLINMIWFGYFTGRDHSLHGVGIPISIMNTIILIWLIVHGLKVLHHYFRIVCFHPRQTNSITQLWSYLLLLRVGMGSKLLQLFFLILNLYQLFFLLQCISQRIRQDLMLFIKIFLQAEKLFSQS